ncbi:Flavoprotein wrbA [Morus notabilis]|uniref:NAD(P)H dehydrogenase (quinone) n=1 Tax=Morus notabilis TaxID=981085 RepID=W9R191_9ROSA|nr:probable NAD(P)H dehydrogenase (quinone) FQR1-like 1 [Morus notabilis]XP_024021243.1 probable NAD(P)H dehydrogenase (quinone) FQR1-like 1 [Morus notabilis]EXB63606.1 Flavoprotein wrbA [Morus notabilis]
MGKGCGCFPSKKRPPVVVSDHQQRLPNPQTTNHAQQQQQEQKRQQQQPRKVKIFIVFYSMYGHVEILARRVKTGVDSVDGVEGLLYRVSETLPVEILDQMRVPRGKNADVPEISPEELAEADGILFGFPTRYGVMAAQMKAFFDSTTDLWRLQRLAGVPAGFFVSTGTQGGGQETTAWTAITQLAHHGMIYVPIGYTFGAGMFKMDSIRGGSPYGAGVFSGDGTREPSETELALAEHQGKYMAALVKRFSGSP